MSDTIETIQFNPQKVKTMNEGKLEPSGNWKAAEGSPFRSLTLQEVSDLRQMAETTTPIFSGPNNATWEQTHPVAREVYEKRGFKPKDAK